MNDRKIYDYIQDYEANKNLDQLRKNLLALSKESLN